MKKVCLENKWDYESTLSWYLEYLKLIKELQSELKYKDIQVENLGTITINSIQAVKLQKKDKYTQEEKAKIKKLEDRKHDEHLQKIQKNVYRINKAKEKASNDLLRIQTNDIQKS